MASSIPDRAFGERYPWNGALLSDTLVQTLSKERGNGMLLMIFDVVVSLGEGRRDGRADR